MKDITELVIIIDQSGSMHGLEGDVIGGYNSLIEQQSKLGETRVTTIFFNSKVEFVHKGVDIKEVKPLGEKTYRPCGCTALLDAIGLGIDTIKEKQDRLVEKEKPSHTIFSIMTDGLENSSMEYTYPQIKNLIETRKKEGWDFLFQAANIDVIKEASRLGIDPRCSMEFAPERGKVMESMLKANLFIGDIRRKPRK